MTLKNYLFLDPEISILRCEKVTTSRPCHVGGDRQQRTLVFSSFRVCHSDVNRLPLAISSALYEISYFSMS